MNEGATSRNLGNGQGWNAYDGDKEKELHEEQTPDL